MNHFEPFWQWQWDIWISFIYLSIYVSFFLPFSSQLYIRSLTLDSWPALSSTHADDHLTRWKVPKSQYWRESSRQIWKQLRWRLHRDQRFFHLWGGSNGQLIIEISQVGSGTSEDDQSPDPGLNSGNECSAWSTEPHTLLGLQEVRGMIPCFHSHRACDSPFVGQGLIHSNQSLELCLFSLPVKTGQSCDPKTRARVPTVHGRCH